MTTHKRPQDGRFTGDRAYTHGEESLMMYEEAQHAIAETNRLIMSIAKRIGSSWKAEE